MTPHPTTLTVWTQLSEDLRRFLRRRVRDEHVADDLLQETFLRIHRGIDALEDADRVQAWVYRIARNVVIDHFRRAESGVEPLAEWDPPDEASPQRSGCAGACHGAEWMDELVNQLPDGYREAVRFSEIDGVSQQAVADHLQLSLSGAKSRIQRGRQMLRSVLDDCCRFEFDRRGRITDIEPRPERTVCRNCDELEL